MKLRKFSAPAILLVAGALVLGACQGPSTESPSIGTTGGATGTGAAAKDSVTAFWNQPLFSWNEYSINGNATANANVAYLTRAWWTYYDKDLNLVHNEKFGKFEKVSDDPLKVKYTIADGVKWSDDVAVTPADMLLMWAGQSGNLNDKNLKTDKDGNTITTGDQVYFDGSDPGLALITETPVIEGNSITFTYSKPFASWEYAFSMMSLPAHAVAMKALGETDATKATDALVKAIQDNDRATLAKIAPVWSTGFDFTSMPSDKSLALSSGAYIMTDYVENQYMTLKANPAYTWGEIPKIKTITIRYSEDATAAVQALSNGEADIIQPQSTPDVLTSVQALTTVDYATTQEGTYEHIDLTFDNKGPFDPASYNGDAAKALKVRQAFLKTIPRQEILQKLIAPIEDGAKTRDSFNLVPGSPNYAKTIEENGSKDWADVDVDGAKKLLQEAGVQTPVKVRFLYGKSNTRRASEFQILYPYAKQAGFELEDVSSDKWGEILGDGSYDAALFGWQSTSTAVSEPKANFYSTKGDDGKIEYSANNFGHYYSEEVNKLYDQLDIELDPAKQEQINIEVEQHLFNDGFGTILFQFPGLTSWNKKLTNVSSIALSPTYFWNYWEWEWTS